MPNPKHVYPFEACFFAAGTAGFYNCCQRCQQSPDFLVKQKVGRRNRVTAYCKSHLAKLTGELIRHEERLSSTIPASQGGSGPG